MGSSRAWMFAFAVAAFLSSIVSYGVAGPLAPDRLRDPAGVIQGFQARAALPAVAFSPDGTRLGVLGPDAVVTLWDVASGQPGPVLRSQGADITALAFDPSGRSVAGVGDDDRIILWDITTGIERLTLFPGPLGSNVRAVGFNPEGTALASLGDDSSIIVWDAATGNAARVLSGHSDAISSLAFHPDGTVLASGSRDSTVALWDLSSRKERVTLDSPSPIERVAFNADGHTVAGVGQDGHIMLWSFATGKLEHVLAGHAAVTEAAFSPDGRGLVSVGTDARITLWDAATGRRRSTLGNQAGITVNDVAFSPDGKNLASATDDIDIALWDVGTGRLRRILAGHDDSVASVAYSPDGRTLASVGKDGQVIVWAVATGKQRFERHVANPEAAAGPAVGVGSPTGPTPGKRIQTGGEPPGGSATGGDATQTANQSSPGATRRGRKARGRDWGGITNLAVSPDGRLIGTAEADSVVRLFDADGEERFALRAHHDLGIAGVAFTADGRRLLSAGGDTEIHTWDVTAGTEIQTLRGHEHPIRSIAASPDGKVWATAGEETRIMLWDAGTGKLVRMLFGHVDFVNEITFSPDGTRLATGGADGRLLLWEVASGKLLRTFLGHRGAINAIAFGPNGRLLVSASDDASAIVWDATAGRQLRALRGHRAPLRAITISPNGQTLATSGEDGQILLWDPTNGRLRRSLAGNAHIINVLRFHPNGRLFAVDEGARITDWDVATGKKMRTIKPRRRPKRENRIGQLIGQASSVAYVSTSPVESGATSRAAPQPTEERQGAILEVLLEWLVPAARAQTLPDPNQGPGGPILVIRSSAATHGRYYAEILRTEGLNAFTVADISTVDQVVLSAHDVVILAPVSLTGAQVTMFTNWVNGGGNLIAMRPDPQLAGLLGLSPVGSTVSNGYLLVDTTRSPGNGIVGQTIQFHGTADRYTLNGATSVATLYSDAATPTTNPAVTVRSVGGNGGQAAAFAYDLATSVVYTRQGNPAWATQERDGITPIRPDDKFFGNASGDSQPDWVDFSKIVIPQADEQQRLLANLILEVNLDRKPLPRFWYFPRGEKAVVIMTGDDHGGGATAGTAGRFDQFSAQSPSGCSVANWECIRGTSYLYADNPLTAAQAAGYNAAGFEVGFHVNTNCADFTPASLAGVYSQQIADWTAKYAGIPAPLTQRHHCVVWSDWLTGAKVQLTHGIRLDTTYHFWPPGWVLNRTGFFTGSGMPMRFADLDGTLVDVYQAVSQMTDESGQQYPLTVDTLLDNALGARGHYGAFGLAAHTDLAQNSVSDAVLASALSRGVPIVSSRQMLEWLNGRNSSSFGSLAWSGNALSFTVTAGSGANGLEALVPMVSAAGLLTSISRGGGSITFSGEVIKGVEYARIAASAGSYTATYTADATPPTVISVSPLNGATAVSQGTAVTVTFSEAMTAGTVTPSTFELRGPGNTLVPASVVYNAANRTATLAPAALLAPSTAYTATVQGGAGGLSVKDLSGNAMTGDFIWSFTTAAGPSCPCSGWSPSTVPGTPANPDDPSSVELGVKFRPAVNGFVNGIRFYKGSTNTGTHTGTLWTVTGQQLATATFTSETATGWQEVRFATPVSVLANTVYVASYHAPNGNYAVDRFYFANSGFDSGPLHFLKDGASGGNGGFVYSAGTTFPTNSFEATNYWVDVVFATTFSDTAPPSVVARSPASGATDVNTGSSVTATFDEAIVAATINGSTFELRDSGNGLVSAAVTYNGATKTATLTPTSALGNLAAYTATLRGGATDPRIKDLSGNALAANVSWSFTTAPVVAACVSAPNAIVAENCQPGNPSSEWEITGIGDLGIQGFATDISVNRGQTVSFKVSTPASNYRLDIYRMGYYGGLGARKVATVQPSVALPQSQPTCLSDANTGLVDCGNWAVSASWGVPAAATSGIYFAKAVRTDTGGASHIFFIVRDDAGTSNLLFQTSDTTWQAYNSYGGNSLYVGAPAGRAYKVSYNRPVNTRVSFNGNSWVFNAEYPMVRWLERNGYDVSYSTGVDSDRRGNLIGNHKVFLSVGHDEYWSSAQRTNVEAARNAGVHLAFFSGNEVFWKTRWENSIGGSATPYRTLVCYKETHANAKIDPLPNVWTGTWRDPRFGPHDGGRPENALMGTIFTVNDGPGTTTSIKVPEADGKMRLWRNTSIATLAPGTIATLPFGTLGYEWDEDLDNGFRPGGIIRMSSTTVGGVPLLQDFGSTYASGTATHHLTLYRHSSNKLVFGAGTVQWSWGLDDNHDHPTGPPDARMQQATVNLLADMGVPTTTLQPGLVPASASTDTAPPSSTITSPTSGASVPRFSAATISGTATDAGGGVVGGVEVSVDNGATWHPATGRTSWSYIWSPQTSGAVTIRSRAIDDSGNIETPGAGVNVTVSGASPTLVAAYSFGEGVGGSVADASGNAHTGAISGATWTTAGRFGNALNFDGTNDWVTVADAADLDLTTGMTLEAWVNPSVLSGWRTAIMKESAGGLAYSLYANDAATRPAAYANTGGADQAAIGAGSLPLSTWTHLAASYNGSTLRLFVNGTEVGSQPVGGSLIATIAPLRIGGNSVWGEYFAGLIDEVRVYSGPLTASEIQADMVTPVGSSGDTTPPTPPSALSATAASTTQVNLIWTASTDNVGVTGYRVERCQGAGCTSFAQVSAPTGTSFLDSGLAVATTYQYRVRAADTAGNLSGYSNVATATTQTASDTIPPTAPTNLSATAVSATQINLSWTASSDNVGVSGYQVERCQGAGCTTFVQVTTPTGTSYSDSGLTAGTTYQYRVRAIDAAGNLSGYSNVAAATTQTTGPPVGLVAAYGFNEGAGTTAADASGNGHAGTVTGAVWSATGPFGGALSFNGTNDWVTVADAVGLDLTTGMTLEAWVNPTALSGWRTVMMKESTGGLSYSLYAHDNAPRPAATVNTGGGDVSAIGSAALPLNTWTHLAATYNGAALRLYVSGAEVGSLAVSGSLVASASPLRFGGNAVWGEYFAGRIDEVRVYNRALTQSEIQTDMNTPIGGGGAPDTTPPAVPSNLSATAFASGVVVSWSANTDPDLAGYHVYRRAGGTGAFTRVDASLLTSPTFDDTLAPGGTSDYTVTAADTSGNESAQAPSVSATMAQANRVLNPGFEIDTNNDTRPDSWSTDSRFTRSLTTARSGTYSGWHFATTNAGYTITQVVTGLSAGTTYTVAGWVNIPATSDAFTFTVRVRWRNFLNSVIRTDTVKTYTATTAGWNKALASLVTPAGTTNAQVQMVVSSLNATVYVDDFALR